jgi:hypothetical protein
VYRSMTSPPLGDKFHEDVLRSDSDKAVAGLGSVHSVPGLPGPKLPCGAGTAVAEDSQVISSEDHRNRACRRSHPHGHEHPGRVGG